MIKHHILYNDFCDYRFTWTKAKGRYIWDTDGHKLLDFTSGWNVANLGWNHPEITEAIIVQAKKNVYAPMWTADPVQESYGKAFIASLPKPLSVIGRSTGGTEANEEAIKTARAYTGRKKILGFRDTYHGQSLTTLAIGYLPNYPITKAVSPLPEGFVQMDFPKVYGKHQNEKEILSAFAKELESILKREDIAAIICEAGIITGWGSTYVAPKGFLKTIRDITRKYGTLIILDEVGTGFSRLGKLYGMELENVVPDIATFAKGMCNGAAAIGTMVTTEEIGQKTYMLSNLTSTFGWTPVGCAIAQKVLEIHKHDRLWEKSQKDGVYLLSTLKKELLGNPHIEEIQGIGMEIGVHLTKPDPKHPKAPLLVERAHKAGLHLVSDTDSNIQIMPPLTITQEELDKGIDIFVSLIKSL